MTTHVLASPPSPCSVYTRASRPNQRVQELDSAVSLAVAAFPVNAPVPAYVRISYRLLFGRYDQFLPNLDVVWVGEPISGDDCIQLDAEA